MKVYLDMEYPCLLRRRFELEGDEVVVDACKADFVFSDRKLVQDKSLPPVVGGNMLISREVLEAFGYGLSPTKLTNYWISRWFDPFSGFSPQLIFTFPLLGLMNGGLSENVIVGAASRFCNESPLSQNFNCSDLSSMLKEMKYIGFVSLGLDLESYVNSLHLGIPARGFYNVVEGTKGKLSDLLTNHEHNLLTESWSVNLLVSRFPYPHALKSQRTWLRGLCSDFERHFCFFDLQGTKKAYYIDSTLVGLSTAWGNMLGEANRRALWTAQGLDVPKLQYRTDLSRTVAELWHILQAQGVVGLALQNTQQTSEDHSDPVVS